MPDFTMKFSVSEAELEQWLSGYFTEYSSSQFVGHTRLDFRELNGAETHYDRGGVTRDFDNGMQIRTDYAHWTSGSYRVENFTISDADDNVLFSMPDLKYTSPNVSPSAISDHFGRFSGVTLELSDRADSLDGSHLLSGGISAAFDAIYGSLVFHNLSIAHSQFEDLADESLLIDFNGGSDQLILENSRAEVILSETAEDRYTITYEGRSVVAADLEELVLADGTFVFDENGAYADYTYALYAAALARTPDEAGFRFWNGIMNSGDFDQATRQETEVRLAEEFVKSDEFNERFDVGTTDGFVTALYQNVLGRDPDQPGFEFWTGIFDTGEQGRDDMLRYFAVSEENMMPLTIEGAADGAFWVV